MEAVTITDTGFPVATRSLLADHEFLGSRYNEGEINQPLFALIKARKALGDARIACSHARRLSNNVNVRIALDDANYKLTLLIEEFPLTILDNGGNRPRPSIIGK